MVYLTTGTDLTLVADAIREKAGITGRLEYPDEYVSKINGISLPSKGKKWTYVVGMDTIRDHVYMGDGHYIARNSFRAYYSSDGTTYAPLLYNGNEISWPDQIVYGNGTCLISSDYYGVLYIEAGGTFAPQPVVGGPITNHPLIHFKDGKYFVLSDKLYYSSDGKNYTDTGFNGYRYGGIAYVNGSVIVLDSSGYAYASSDLSNFVKLSQTTTYNGIIDAGCCAYLYGGNGTSGYHAAVTNGSSISEFESGTLAEGVIMERSRFFENKLVTVQKGNVHILYPDATSMTIPLTDYALSTDTISAMGNASGKFYFGNYTKKEVYYIDEKNIRSQTIPTVYKCSIQEPAHYPSQVTTIDGNIYLMFGNAASSIPKYSTDGINWTEAVGYNGGVLTEADILIANGRIYAGAGYSEL